jgi:threonine dehydrogenase-like Zn-dependent dehydrogenase
MKGLIVNFDGSVAIKEMPRPQYGEYQALVKIKSGGLCGTDLKILHNKLKFFSDYPTILGHEGVGEIIEKGAKVRSFDIGDQVVLPYIFEKCGDYYSTWGAFAEYAIVGDTEALYADGYKVDNKIFYDFYHAQRKIPKEIDPVAACMIVTFREVYSAIKKMNFKSGQNIVIYGAGAVGLVFITFAKMLGMGTIVSIDLRDEKNEQAKKAGADFVFNSKKVEVVQELKKLFPSGVDITLDAAGVPELINTSLQIISDGGAICVYGVTPKNEALINWDKAPYNWNLKFIQWPSKMEEAENHDQIIEWILEGKLRGLDYISDVYNFDESIEAIKLFESGVNLKKIAIRY